MSEKKTKEISPAQKAGGRNEGNASAELFDQRFLKYGGKVDMLLFGRVV